MNPEKLILLLQNIRRLNYPREVLSDVDKFEARLIKDLQVDRQEALALLGYLLTKDYVRIVPDMGLVVNPASKEIQKLIQTGQLT